LEFAKELVVYEKLGAGSATDLLVISLSANDILGHQVGPDSPQMRSMALELDRSWRISSTSSVIRSEWPTCGWRFPPITASRRCRSCENSSSARRQSRRESFARQINSLLSKKYAKKADYVLDLDYPVAWLNEDAFAGIPSGIRNPKPRLTRARP
jgi:hypothetical protein